MTKKQEDLVINTLTPLVEKLLSLMGTSSAFSIEFDSDSDSYIVNIEGGNETGLMIGRKGETLLAIQTVLGLMLKQKIGDWKRVVVNVGDYREKEEDYLKNLALNACSRARETGSPQALYNLNPSQRRVVHMVLANEEGIVTESVGEGADRYLVVKTS